MTPVECEFEAEVLAAVLQGRWPERTDHALRAHVAGCAICSDVAAIAGVIEQAREETSARAAIPDSGRIWWMAQLRARREAIEAANRPMTAAQVIAFACAVGMLATCFRASSAWLSSAFGRVASAVPSLDMGAWLAPAVSLLGEHAVLALAMAVVLFLVPAAAYLAIGRD